MSYYDDVYLKRLNRYGTNYQSRVQAQREKEFEGKLLKSVYRVDFEYNNKSHPGTLERYKQDETELMQYLLTRVGLNIPNGTILMIPDKDYDLQPWLVYWMESIKASGYNRYIVLKLNHCISWCDRNGKDQNTLCYFYSNGGVNGNSGLKETIKAVGAIYAEDGNTCIAIMPTNENLNRDDYIEIGEGSLKEAYRVTGYDIHSVPGVEYVSLDPVYLRDHSALPVKKPGDNPQDYFWLNGGEE